jgi:hypothetical protein
MDNTKEIVKAIKRKIHYERNDTLLNHLRTYLQLDQLNYSGKCGDNKFSIWRYSSFTGIFYLVIDGKIDLKNSETKVFLTARPNKAGLLLTAIAVICFSIGIFSVKFTSFNILSFLLRLFFATIPILVTGLIYLNQRQKTIEGVKQLIKDVC